MDRKRALAAGAVVAVAVVILSYLAYVFLTPVEKSPAPDFSINDVYGTPFDLSEQKGKVVLLEFTAIECTGCKLLFPKLIDIRNRYGPELVMVSVYTYPFESESDVRNHRESKGANWTFARDPGNLLALYNAAPIPKTFIIDKEGDIIFQASGDLAASALTGPIDAALKGTATSSVSVGSAFLSGLGLGGLALMAGLVCFFSPCAFPMLPGYMTYYLKGSESGTSYRKAAAGGTAAALGIFLVYGVIGLVVAAVGGSIIPYMTVLQPVIGVILLVLGALLLLPFTFVSGRFLERIQKAQEGRGFHYGLFLYGVGYGAASQACTAPVFIGAIIAGFQTGSVLAGVGVLLVACLVALFLMIGVTLLVAGSKKAILNRLKASTGALKNLSAVVMIIAGVYLVVEYWLAFG